MFLIAGVTLQSDSGQLTLATKLARNQARGKFQCCYNTEQNGFIPGGAKSFLTILNIALFCPYDVTDGAIWSTNLPKALKKGAKASLT